MGNDNDTMQIVPDAKDAQQTEILSRLWRLLGERREIVDKVDTLHDLLGTSRPLSVEVIRGRNALGIAVDDGLEANRSLVLEALLLLGKLDAEEESDEGDGEG